VKRFIVFITLGMMLTVCSFSGVTIRYNDKVIIDSQSFISEADATIWEIITDTVKKWLDDMNMYIEIHVIEVTVITGGSTGGDTGGNTGNDTTEEPEE